MNVIYDKSISQLAILDAPLEANKVSIKVNEFNQDFTLTNGKLLLTNFNVNIPLTLQAIKVEEVEDLVPQVDAQGQPLLGEGGNPLPLIVSLVKVETVLEKVTIDLKML